MQGAHIVCIFSIESSPPFQERSRRALNLKDYEVISSPKKVGYIKPSDIKIPPLSESQYVLRMMIRAPFTDFLVPDHIKWTLPIIEQANEYQKCIINVSHAFAYITIRHGKVISTKDDEWHVDGFSTQLTHLLYIHFFTYKVLS